MTVWEGGVEGEGGWGGGGRKVGQLDFTLFYEGNIISLDVCLPLTVVFTNSLFY